MIFFGIDPGFTGAIAIYHPAKHWLEVHDMPTLVAAKGKQELDHFSVLNLLEAEDLAERHTVWLEKVGARPGQGVSSMFRFGQQLGALEMAAAAHGHQLRYVTPAKWKGHFGLSASKGAARGVAMQRFPQLAQRFARAKDDGRAEAALIALYGAEVTR
jgi:crossover junction endodeoxyribonuclease RuvC